MKTPGYFAVLCVALGLVLNSAAGQDVGAGAAEEVPQSDFVIDQIGGEVNIGPNDVVKRAKLLFGKLEIEGTVVEDVQMIAGEIDVRGRVYDRVELVAGEVTVSGHVGPGGVDVKFGEITVSGVVEGPVTVELGEVKVTETGVIQGNVRVKRGELTRVEDSARLREWITGIGWDWARPFTVFIGLMTLIGLAAIILIIAILFRSTIQKGATLMQKENLAWNLLWGGVAILLFVPIFVTLCVTIIGIPVAFLLLFLYPVAWLFGLILLADYLGDWILTHLIKGQSNFLVGTIFGIIILGISMAVPVFGGILTRLYTLLAFGISFRMMFGYFQEWRKEQRQPEAIAES